MSTDSVACKLLDYPQDARLLILNADDFGMCQSINEAILRSLKDGVASSCTLMAPCPWGGDGLHRLEQDRTVSFGIHLTVISEQPYYRWGPLSSREHVPALVDDSGYFYSYDRIHEFIRQVSVEDLEREFRTQIDRVLATGLTPTHLDSHCHVHTRREDIFEMTFRLARKYGLALRANETALIEKLRRQGLPANDHDVLDSYRLETADKSRTYERLLRELPEGLSEWAIHPGIGNSELRAMEPITWDVRQADFDFFTSPQAREIIQKEGILVLDYKPIQKLWQTM